MSEQPNPQFSLAADRDSLDALRRHRTEAIEAALVATENQRPTRAAWNYDLEIAIANLETAGKRDKIAERQADSLRFATYVLAIATVVLAATTITLVVATVIKH